VETVSVVEILEFAKVVVASNVESHQRGVKALTEGGPRQRIKLQGRETMGEPSIEVLCKNCGQTFTAFLKEMEKKNAEVTCPCCGKSGGNVVPSNAIPPVALN
jgi:DNA-directed RNA polymerase subunit RPC12/RpoP